MGGYLRDIKLNISIPHDVDIVTNCSPMTLSKLFPDFIKNAFNQKLFFRKGTPSIDIYCTDSPIKKGLASRDVTINTLLCDVGNVYDVLNIRHDFDNPCLNLMGNLEQRLQEDPSLILRLMRLTKVTGKALPYHYVAAIQRYASGIVKLPFGIYASNLDAMFLRGQASYNLYYLDQLSLFTYLLPFPLQKIALDIYHQTLHFIMVQMLKIDQLSPDTEIKDKRLLLVALFLLSDCLQRIHLKKADSKEVMDKVVNEFYDFFKVVDFKKRHQTLPYLHQYYQQFREIVDNNAEVAINLELSQQRAAQAARGELFIPDLAQSGQPILPYYKERTTTCPMAETEMMQQKMSYHYVP